MDPNKKFSLRQQAMWVVRQVSPAPYRVVTIIIGPTELPCDLDLLQKNSSHFVRGQSGMAYGLPSCDVSLEAFMIIYKWMARPHEVVPPRLLMAVYRAAMYLRVDMLLVQFMEEFKDPRTAREEIGFYMFYGLSELNINLPFRKELRVNKYFLTLIGSTEFVTLWPDVIEKLLNSSNICVNTEMEVFLAAIIWLHHDYDERREYVDRLMECVRFNCIPLEALLHLRHNGSQNKLTQLLFRPEIEKYIKLAPTHNNNIRYCNRRVWVYDELCAYHHDAHCRRRNFITLELFEDYQRALLEAPNLHWWHRHQLNPYVHSCRSEKCKYVNVLCGRI